MSNSLIEFFLAGFDRAMMNQTTQLTRLLETTMTTLLEQISQLKVEQSLTADKIQQLIDASTEEREQVGGLISVTVSQQETITQLNAKIEELTGMLANSDTETQAALEELTGLLATTTEQSEQIASAIEGIKEIYNPA